jgi:phosphoribosylaminoimidazole-succinocarboxamide synthase
MKHLHSGKVRDLYQTDEGLLLMVASDRISAFDHVLEPDIPDKGAILTRMSLWWFDQLRDLVPNHVVAPGDEARSVLVGLADGSRLPEPIFTPSTKAPLGEHDEPISFDQVVAEVGAETAEELRRVTLAVYTRGAEIARERGIILADTKIELGWDADGVLTLGDEVLTPDSSRFWPAEEWQPGRRQPSFDKQYVRDWLTSPESGWDKNSTNPPPRLPDKVVMRTRQRYLEAYERITGTSFTG